MYATCDLLVRNDLAIGVIRFCNSLFHFCGTLLLVPHVTI